MTMHNKCATKPLVLAIASALLSLGAQAQNLAELYDSARAFDAAYQSAKLQYDANLSKAEQARAGLLPTAGVTAGVSRTGFQNSNPVTDRTFSTQNIALNATQPLYRPANLASYEQGQRQIDLAKAQLDAAEQDLIVRTSQGYFDVLAAQDTLADTREAQARFDLVVAQEISADNDLRVKKIALDTLVGKTGAQPKGLLVPVALPAVLPLDVNAWVQQSELVHPSIRLAQNNVDIADLEIKKAEAGHKPTLDATASYNVQRNPSGTVTSLPNTFRTNTTNIGLSFNLPLFAGFATQNRIKETLSLKDKAQNDLEGAKRTVALATRTAYFGVQSGQGQVKALEAAELSSQSALDANKLGYQVGVRINIDVLNSQSQLFQTKRDLAQARYNVLLGGLRLRQANGTLSQDDLRNINALFAK
jgi:outer membrane protein